MRQFGLIGYPLSHSFSQKFFTEKFLQENILNAQYDNFPIESIQSFTALWEQHPSLEGLNVTIPYKKEVISFLKHSSPVVQEIHACNCIRKFNNELYGYNTDVIGFEKSLLPFLQAHHKHALILGTGGAAAAVKWVLQQLNIQYQVVSRKGNNLELKTREVNTELKASLSYEQLTKSMVESHTLIINTSPLGMFPNVNEAPPIPYDAITAQHHLYDLVYNPTETLFMKKGLEKGATIQNGLAMLHIQAEESWTIWNAKM
ncbi:MAG: shikimate dehydrogenase [Chitinophagia bacterium]|nr:shikimate dehydrogenase [Chitinophagia bacterium]NCA29982.1 shikimate dehydrogenase [Chitinophagia bacterium]NDD16133.1 shikimate dehydrogenase [Chitinophagia bacterium]